MTALLFYRRIFCSHTEHGGFVSIMKILIIITVLWTIAMTLMNALQCGSDISALWSTDAEEPMAKCIYVYSYEMGFAISNFLLDLIVIVLPIPKVSPIKQDMLLTLNVSLRFGLFICVLVVKLLSLVFSALALCKLLLSHLVYRTISRVSHLSVLLIFHRGFAGCIARLVIYLQIAASESAFEPNLWWQYTGLT